MFPTFVIGLREGLEAALIIGIIAAFLRKQGRRDLLRWVWIGVGTAILLCVLAGTALKVLSQDLPQRQQEGLETIIGALAVGMVTYMVIWMKRNSRQLKGQLEGLAADAMAGGSGAGRAMVAMAFLAVLREGVETVIFLLAAFNQSASGPDAAGGATLGILVAVGLGYGIYRGGVRLNLSKFFRATGLVLVIVAAGLVVNALRTAHEAGWINFAQGRTVDLTWLVDPGSVQASLLTGMLGLQSRPVVIEVVGWLIYLVPVGLYVAWPPGRALARRSVARALLVIGGGLAASALVLTIVVPSPPGRRPVTAGAQVVSTSSDAAVVRVDGRDLAMRERGTGLRGGVETEVFTARRAGTQAASLPTTLSYDRVAELNGGHLPIGLKATAGEATVRYTDTTTLTVWIEPRTQRVVDLRSSERITAAVVDSTRGTLPLSRPVSTIASGLPVAAVRSAAAAAADDVAALERRSLLAGLAWTAGALGGVLLLAGAALLITPRRGTGVSVSEQNPVPDLLTVRLG